MIVHRRYGRRALCSGALALAVLVVSAPARAQRAEATPLPPVFVTAARTPQSLEQLVADVTVVDAEEIARSGAQSLAELLQRHAGLEIIMNGGPASTSGVFIRGANRNQTLLLIDGMRVSSATVGAPSLEAVPLDQIERIEILRGPASSLYGADAIGGVIQVFTRKPDDVFRIGANAGYGTYDTRTGAAHVGAAIGALRFSLGAGGRRSDGFNATTEDAAFIFNPDRDGYRSDDVSAAATLVLAPGQEIGFDALRNRLDAQFDGGPSFDDRTRTTLQTWRVQSRNRLADRWTSRLWLGDGTDSSVSTGAFGEASFVTRQRQYGWQNDFEVPSGALTLAVERREESVEQQAGFAVTDRNTNALTGVWQWQHEAHALQANLRHDRSDQFGGETTGAIAWGWRFAPAWRVTASYGTAFKPPSFNDLYFPGFSNAALRPEQARNVEAGIYWTQSTADRSVELRAVAWHNRVRDLIVFQCDADFNCLPRNVADATLEGVTLGTTATFGVTTMRASLDLQSPKDEATGHLLPRLARQHGVVAVLHQLGPAQLGVEVVASSHRFDDAENLRRLGGYTLVNVTAAWNLPQGVTLFARADNVFDRDYTLAYGFATPGAQVFAGLRWQMP
jgi:vitamin B12 transporter